jgi:hypothetical protein
MINRLWILLCLLLTGYEVISQSLPRENGDTSGITGDRLAARFVKDINVKSERLDQKLDKYIGKVLKKVQNQESDLRKKLEKQDSLTATIVFGNAECQYKQLHQRLQNTRSIQHYVPAFDTINTFIKFLQENPQLAAIKKESVKLKETLAKVHGLGSRLKKAEEVKKFLKERKQYLNDQLQNPGFAKQLKKLNKQAYYYGEQLNEYKSLLKDHTKAERKVIELLSKTKLFQNFMRKNSMLASLFRLPADASDPINAASLGGLQTRAQVNRLIQQQIGANDQAQRQQNMLDAQSQLQQLKNKECQFGSNSSDAEIPEGFKPNQQKTNHF